MMTELRVTCTGESETRKLGAALGGALLPGLTVLLYGDLGSGKTVLVRGVGDALGLRHVKSPSFTLVNEYPVPALTKNSGGVTLVAHADLYRLESYASNNPDALGLNEYVLSDGAVLFVEWPERWPDAPERDILTVRFEAPEPDTRLVMFTGDGLGEKVLAKLKDGL